MNISITSNIDQGTVLVLVVAVIALAEVLIAWSHRH